MPGSTGPTSGSVWIDGTEITELDDKHLTELRRDKLGFVFQFFNLVPVLNAEENIALPVRIAGRRTSTAPGSTSLLDTVGLTDRRTHRPSELSGGQQQRVAIARALMTKPAVVFADEPTGNLDSKSGADVLGLLRKSVDEFQQTVVMVTHDPRVASYRGPRRRARRRADRPRRQGRVAGRGAAADAGGLIGGVSRCAASRRASCAPS